MNRCTRIILLAVATAVVLALALVSILDRPATRSGGRRGHCERHGGSRVQHASSGFDGAPLPGGAGAPNFTLTDQHGRRVSLGQYRGRVVDPHLPVPRLPAHLPADRPADPRRARRTGYQPRPYPPPPPRPGADREHRPGRRHARRRAPLPRRSLPDGPRRVPDRHACRTAAGLARLRDRSGALGDAASAHAASVLLIDRAGQKRDLFEAEELTPEGLAHDMRKLGLRSAPSPLIP